MYPLYAVCLPNGELIPLTHDTQSAARGKKLFLSPFYVSLFQYISPEKFGVKKFSYISHNTRGNIHFFVYIYIYIYIVGVYPTYFSPLYIRAKNR